jgi:hypothetical protein
VSCQPAIAVFGRSKPIGFFGLHVRNMQQGSAEFVDAGPFGPALQIIEARELF